MDPTRRTTTSTMYGAPVLMKVIDTDFILIRLADGCEIRLMLQPDESFKALLTTMNKEIDVILADRQVESVAQETVAEEEAGLAEETAAEEDEKPASDQEEPSFTTTESSFCELIERVNGLGLGDGENAVGFDLDPAPEATTIPRIPEPQLRRSTRHRN